MTIISVKYVNEGGGIQAEQDSGVSLYLEPGSDLHQSAVAGAFGAITAYEPPASPTSADLDAIAAVVADELLDQDLKMKALALVIADLVEATFNVSQSVARQQVKTRFRDYYRALLDQ